MSSLRSLTTEEQYSATPREWENFLNSRIWHDLQLFITDRVEVNRDMLELSEDERKAIATDKGIAYESADIIRGRNREAKMLLFAPGEILKELQEQEEESDD